MYGPARNAPQYRPRPSPAGHQLPGPPPPGMMNMNRPYGHPVMQGRGGPMHPSFHSGQQQPGFGQQQQQLGFGQQQQQPGFGQQQQQQQPGFRPQQQQPGFAPPPGMPSAVNHGMPPPNMSSGMPPGPPPRSMGPLQYATPHMPFRAPAGPLPRGPPLPGPPSVLPPPPVPPPSFTIFPQNPPGDAPPPPMPPPSPPPPPSSPPPPPPPPPPPSPLPAETLTEAPTEVLPEAPAEAASDLPQPDPPQMTSLSAPPPRPGDKEVVCNIETLARFVAKNGPEFENLARAREAGNPKFAFLFSGEYGSDAAIGFEYFQWMKMKCDAELKIHQETEVKQLKGTFPLSGPTHELEQLAVTLEGVSNSPGVPDTEMEGTCCQPRFEGPSVEDLSPVQSSPKELQNISEGPSVQDASPVRSCPNELQHASEELHVEDLSPVRSSPEELQHASKGLHVEDLSPVQTSPKELQHASEGNHFEHPSPVKSPSKELQHASKGLNVGDLCPVQSSLKELQHVSEGLHVEDLSPVPSPKDLLHPSEALSTDLSPVHSLKRLQEMYIEDLSPVQYSPKESEPVSEGPSVDDLNLTRSSPKDLPHTPMAPSTDLNHVENLSLEEKVPKSSESGIQNEGHISPLFVEDQAAEFNVEPERDITKESSDLTPVCESARLSTVPVDDERNDDDMVIDMSNEEIESDKSIPDNNTSMEASEPLKQLGQPFLYDNEVKKLGNGNEVSNVEKPTNEESKMLNVDEFGRLIREGASDSESDGVLYTGKAYTSRSWSRSRSPVTRSRRRRSPSPWRRKGRRSKSHSRSPRRKRSRSRTPPSEFRHGAEPGEGRKRKATVPECIFFKREGGCNRGASCRFIHQEAPSDNLSKWSSGGKIGGYRETVHDIESSHTATEISGNMEESKGKGKGKGLSPDELSEKEDNLNEAALNKKGSPACNEEGDLQLPALNVSPDSQPPTENAKPDSYLHSTPLENEVLQPPVQAGVDSKVPQEETRSQPLHHEDFRSQPLRQEDFSSQPLRHEDFSSQPLRHEDFSSQPVSFEDFRSQPLSKPSALEGFQSQSFPRPPVMEELRSMQPSNAFPVGDFRSRPIPMEDFRSQPLPGAGLPGRMLPGEDFAPRPVPREDARSRSEDFRSQPSEDSRSLPMAGDDFRFRPLPGKDTRSWPLPQEDFRSRPPPGEDFRSRPPPGEDFRSWLPPPPPPQDFRHRLPLGEDFRSRPPLGGDFHSRPPLGEEFRSRPPLGEEFRSQPPLGEEFRSQTLPAEEFRSRTMLGEDFRSRPLPVEGFSGRVPPMGSLQSQPFIREDAHRENFQSHFMHRQDLRSPPLAREDLRLHGTLQEGLHAEPILRRDMLGKPLFMNDSRGSSFLREDLHPPHLLREDLRSHALPRALSQVQVDGFSRESLVSRPYLRDDLRFPSAPRDLPNLQQHDLTRQQLSSSPLMQRTNLQGNLPVLSHLNLRSNSNQRPAYFGGYPQSSNHSSFSLNHNSDSLMRDADFNASSFTAGSTGITQHAPFRLDGTLEPFNLHHLSGSGHGNYIPRPGIEPLPRSLGSNLSAIGGEWQPYQYSHLAGSSVAGSTILHQPGRELFAAGDQYDPLHDSIEPVSVGAHEPLQSFEHEAGKQNDAKAAEQLNIAPVLNNVSPHNGGKTRIGSSSRLLDVEENNKHKNGATSAFKEIEGDNIAEQAMDAEVGAVENGSPLLEEEVKNWSPGHQLEVATGGAGEIEIDQVQTTVKGKKSKDSRSMKLFRLALAEFVKDVLKPAWREGHMSKEAFKTIVKKAVDKVAGAMQSHQIPKTRAKIDQYMASSERKLTKLVQGYMDKYVRA